MAPTVSEGLSCAATGPAANMARKLAHAAAIMLRVIVLSSDDAAARYRRERIQCVLFHPDKSSTKRRRSSRLAAPSPQHEDQQRQQIRRHVHDERRYVGARGLKLQLQALGAAEQQRAGDCPERIPFGENDERDGDKAAARGHALGPGECERDRHMRAGNAAEQASECECLVLHQFRPEACGKGGRRALADGAQAEPPSGAEDQPPGQQRGWQRQINQTVVAQQPRADPTWRKTGNGEPRQAADQSANKRPADQRAQTYAEEHQAETGRQLIGATADHHIGKDEVGRRSCDGGSRDAEIGRAGQRGRGKSAGRADQHDAFEAEIDDAGALTDDLAERCIQERGPRHDRARDYSGDQSGVHRAVLPTGWRPSTMKSMTAMRILTTANGTPWVICRMSPTELISANKNDMITMPLALVPASHETRKPTKPYPGETSETRRP